MPTREKVQPKENTQAGPAKPRSHADDLTGFEGPHQGEYDALIKEMAAQYGVPARLIKAVMSVESSFDPRAVSPAGAQGLMQLMPETGKGLDVVDPYEPRQSVKAGTRLLATLLAYYKGNVNEALAAYNAGPGNVTRGKGVPDIAETREYVARVNGLYDAAPKVSVGVLEKKARHHGHGGVSAKVLYGPPDYMKFVRMVPVRGLDWDSAVQLVAMHLAGENIWLPTNKLVEALLQANPELTGIDQLPEAAQTGALTAVGALEIPSRSKFPDGFDSRRRTMLDNAVASREPVVNRRR